MNCGISRIAELFQVALDLIHEDERHFHVADDVEYFFRGEGQNYQYPDSGEPSHTPPAPVLYRAKEKKLLAHEHDIFYEALRCFPETFQNDRTTFEQLTRLQHYGYPTRLLDVTQKITTALSMVISGGEGNDSFPHTGFLHLYRVNKSKIKYSSSDTVAALSCLAKLSPDKVKLPDLGYLAHEVKNERAGFFWNGPDDDTAKQLAKDIQRVWCVRPIMNNIRIQHQRGEFFLFGCRDEKRALEPSFSEEDFYNPDSPSFGMARIASIAIPYKCKKEALEVGNYLDIGDERVYPDFSHHAQALQRRYK